MIRVLLRSFVPATAILALAAYITLYGRLDGPVPIKSDGYSYYVYLPSWFIYGDYSLEALAADWYGGRYPLFTGLRRWPSTERWMNLHPIGTAILEMPFFLVAGFLYILTEPSLLLARLLLYGYVVSRLLHFAAYLTAQTHDMRATLWTVGTPCGPAGRRTTTTGTPSLPAASIFGQV